jgi:hypothetical protein
MVNQLVSTEAPSQELTFPPLEIPTVLKTLNHSPTNTQISQELNPLLEPQAQENHLGSLFTLRRLSKRVFQLVKEVSWEN